MHELFFEVQRVGTDAGVAVAVGVVVHDDIVDACCVEHRVAHDFDQCEDLRVGFLVRAG